METISISKLKAHLSAEIKKVRQGATLIVMDHNHPVAQIMPVTEDEALFVKEAEKKFDYKKLPPLMDKSELEKILEEDRADK